MDIKCRQRVGDLAQSAANYQDTFRSTEYVKRELKARATGILKSNEKGKEETYDRSKLV